MPEETADFYDEYDDLARRLTYIVKELAYVKRTIRDVARALGVDPERAKILVDPSVGDAFPDALIVGDGELMVVEYVRWPRLKSLARKLARLASEADKEFGGGSYRKSLVVVFYEGAPRRVRRLPDLLRGRVSGWRLVVLSGLRRKVLDEQL